MRFLRRGGRYEPRVEVEGASGDDELQDAVEAPTPPEDETAAPVDDAAAEPRDEPDAEATTPPEADDPVGAEAAPEPEHAATAEPDAEATTPPEAEAPQPEAPEAEASEDDEGLAGLVAGGSRAPTTPPDSASELVAEESPEAARHPAPAFRLADDASPDPLTGGRSAGLRLASLHLHTGQHALARAELEAFAGRGRLDEPALLDLAEVRWRMGDLSGAGDAANALLARGTEAPLALVIAAESVAAAGRPSEARRLSTRALEVADGPLDPLFAGMPRSMIWPAAATPEPPKETPRRRGRRAKGEVDGAPSTAAEAFAGGRGALAKGDTGRAALLLGVAMRLEPGFAEDVLRAVAGRDDQPLLALVRGDALRLLGREADALEAFDRARGRSSATTGGPDEPNGPGLFDDDPV